MLNCTVLYTLSPYDFDIQLQYTFPVFGYVMQFWMAINFSFGTFLSWCGLLNKQCRFEALFSRKKILRTAFHYEGTARPFFVDYCQSHQKERFWLSMWISHLTYLVLIIGYVLWDNSPSGSTDFFILIECFDSQLSEQKTESLFPLKMLRIKKFKTHSLDLPIR